MFDKHKRESLLLRDLLKKLIIIVIGSIVAAYGITLLVVIIGVLLGGKFGICTIITVIISGPIIQFVNAKAKRILKI